MRKFSMILVGACTLALSLIGCTETVEFNVVKQATIEGYTYSYVDIDPKEIIDNWELVATIPIGPRTFEFAYRNPDLDSPFSLSIIFFIESYGVLGYSYIYKGKINVCIFNGETTAYESRYDKLDEDLVLLWKNKYSTYFELTGI